MRTYPKKGEPFSQRYCYDAAGNLETYNSATMRFSYAEGYLKLLEDHLHEHHELDSCQAAHSALEGVKDSLEEGVNLIRHYRCVVVAHQISGEDTRVVDNGLGLVE